MSDAKRDPRGIPTPVGPARNLPARFGKYMLIRRLAVGGMAELFLALQRSVAGFEKLIVVKRVLPHLAQDANFIRMLESEARIAATLNHPNIAHIYDVGEVSGQTFIAMEHVNGQDLRALFAQMRRSKVAGFPLEHVLTIVMGCCAGLAHAHKQKDLNGDPMSVVHRDVSPQNILVTYSGGVKLVDFGIALASQTGLENTDVGQLKGKIPYMSPEQAQGMALDQRSDIFSLGILLFELSTGRRLFKGPTEMETLRRIVEDEYPAPREINPNLHPRLESIIVRALQKDLRKRYQTAAEMGADLEEYVHEERLRVGARSLGTWMHELFREKLESQETLLREGRQLAEVLAAETATDDTRGSIFPEASGGSAPAEPISRVRAKPPSEGGRTKATVALLGLLAVGLIGTGLWVLNRTEQGTSTEHGGIGGPQSLGAGDEGSGNQGAEPPRLAILQVNSTPPGARVMLDGRDTGEQTPTTLSELSAGVDHGLALTLPGYLPVNETLQLEAGQVTERMIELVERPLGPEQSSLSINVRPASATMLLDGQPHEPGTALRLPSGAHTLSLTSPGFRTMTRSLDLPGGEATELDLTLVRSGRRRPATTAASRESGTPAIAREPGRITIGARPWCNVSIDGRAVGQTPVVGHQVSAGRHRILCVNPEQGRREVTVQVPPGQHVRRTISL